MSDKYLGDLVDYNTEEIAVYLNRREIAALKEMLAERVSSQGAVARKRDLHQKWSERIEEYAEEHSHLAPYMPYLRIPVRDFEEVMEALNISPVAISRSLRGQVLRRRFTAFTPYGRVTIEDAG